MHGDYITVRAPLLLSHSGEMGVVRDGCLKRVVPSQYEGAAKYAMYETCQNDGFL